jgi:Beta/Gamma crystallin
MSEKSGCYIDVWRKANFEGETIRIEGPGEYPTLNFVQGDWGDRIGSLRVGPCAFVIAYRDENFGSRQLTFGPDDEVADLAELHFEDEIDSMRLIDSLKIFDRVSYNEARTFATEVALARGRQGKNSGRGR